MVRAWIIFLLLVTPTFAVADDLSDDEIQRLIEEKNDLAGVETVLNLGNDGLQRLRDYREEVESEAYLTTLKLCEGYRRTRGWGPVAAHGHYVFTLQESLAAWAVVAQQGLYQPFSGIAGQKAEYLSLSHSKLLEYDSWFRSLYVLFLIRSMGFLKASMHCLNTIDQGPINMFASSIVIVDSEASLLTQVGLVWSNERIMSMLAKATAFTWTPGLRFEEALAQRLENTKIVFGTMLVVPVSVGGLFAYIKSLEQGHDYTSPQAPSSPLEPIPLESYTEAAKLFYRDFDTKESDYADFRQWVLEHVDEQTRQKASHDLDSLLALQRAGKLSQSAKDYLAVLQVMVPIVEQIH